MSEKTKETLEMVGLIPVLRAKSAKQARVVVEALMAGGVTVIEVTMTVPGSVQLLKDLKSAHGETLLLGAGTVTSALDAEAMIDAGAEFVVSPSLHLPVIETTKRHGKVSIPGALTPTEVITAWDAGADYVKIFPCSALGGASYLKALLAPFPKLKLIPTGGVTLETAGKFLEVGACALGIGSDLVNLAAVDAGSTDTITETAKAYRRLIADKRSSSGVSSIRTE